MKLGRMALMVVVLMALAFAGACGPAIRPQTDTALQQRIEQLQLINRMQLPTVVFVGGGGMGSGIILRQNVDSTLILTARHMARRWLKFSGGWAVVISAVPGTPKCAANVVAVSEHDDLALVMAHCSLRGLPVRFARRLPVVGEDVYILGHGWGQRNTLTKGIVSHARRGLNSSLYIQCDAHGAPGNSGGPLFNKRGELIGVVVSGPIAPVVGGHGGVIVSYMAMSVPLQHVRNFLAKNGALP